MVYRARPRSYRELPFKIAEYGTVYRFERSGQLHGIMRTRGFAQNDAHIYCTSDEAEDQFLEVMRMHDDYCRALGITDFYMILALRDPVNTEKYHDDEEMWRNAERITREAMEESNIPYVEEVGGAAHYGPKIDFVIRAVTGKEFSASTNQVDLYTPQRFQLTYRDSAKVRAAVTRKIPLILVVGRREAEQQTVSVRYRSGEETSMIVDAFVDHALTLVRSKSLAGAGHLWRTNDADTDGS